MDDFGPAQILRILAVTDSLGIHREAVRIPLATEGEGIVRLVSSGRILEIVAPETAALETWLRDLPRRIRPLDLSAIKRSQPICVLCGSPAEERQCKLVCTTCGAVVDCSDP